MLRSQKTRSAGIMRFWKMKPQAVNQAGDQVADLAREFSDRQRRSSFMPGYLRLEQRTLLSATFMTFGTTELVLDDFDAGQNLDFGQQDAVVNGVLQDSYVFTVDSGSFNGNDLDPSIELESVNGGINNQLEVATAFFQGSAANAQLTINGLTSSGSSVEFTQTSSDLIFETLEISNFANDNRDFNLNATGDVTLNNVTVFDSNATDGLTTPATLDVSVNGNLNLNGLTGNLSTDPNADVDLSATGNVSMASGAELTSEQNVRVASSDGSITLTDVSAGDEIEIQAANNILQRFDTEIASGTDITLTSGNGSITLADVTAGDNLQLEAVNNIAQRANSDIMVGDTASFSSTAGEILLAATPNQTLDVQGQASFSANNIEIGLDGEVAGSPLATNVQLGSVSLDASRAVLVEDDATLITGDSNATDLFISSALEIENTANASLNATNAQLNAATDILLGDQVGDSILLGEVSLIAENAHLEVDGDLIINGVAPSAANSQPIPLSTNIDETLFVIADGSVEQTQGNLSARQLGVQATEHVHLTSVADVNEAIAISADGSALLTDASLSSTLSTLAAVENGEVDATRPQAIAVAHRGDAVVTNVTSITGTDSLTGFNSTDGSISVFADQSISLQQDITAFSPTEDPQVTLFSAAGDRNNPAIFFDGGQASVIGPTNFGVVNSNQTFANFFDTDGFVFDDTTTVLTLNPDGSASQDIVIEYGNLGEAGFRVGIVFDSLNEVGAPVEDINLFTPSNTVASEAFEDPLFQENTVTRLLIGGNEGGRETFSKVDDFTAAAVIAHFDDPNVFSDIIVRNDQDINLFSGSLETVDNSLNEIRQQLLQAILDLPRGSALPAPTINVINSIEVRPTFDLPFDSPPPLDQTTSIFDRDVAPFESGELRFVQVEIPVDDLYLVGDEVVLRQPTLLYPAAEDAAEMPFENVGENETDRIANQIERSPTAEPGYWYRIFKAYNNRDDELTFYYFKTGEVDSLPADTPEGEDTLPEDEALENRSKDNEAPEPNASEQELEPEIRRNDFSAHPADSPTDGGSSPSIAASTILLGLLRRETKQNQRAENSSTNIDPSISDPSISDPSIGDPAIGDEKNAQTGSSQSYDRLSRLKRRLKRCL